jgi:hypothetical protein
VTAKNAVMTTFFVPPERKNVVGLKLWLRFVVKVPTTDVVTRAKIVSGLYPDDVFVECKVSPSEYTVFATKR